ncbi:CDP-archaeol synthase [Marinobacter sp. SS21]|uniref:CDP-archaeol synthase n=1 Tax=Marinobacter sp. SS21 TaxID=2979460 RepID=UPI00232FE041|nr:CDP-archaeol synthase [Marinobacter sp. SS21]MDC0663140.1 CDP-archaeol synthase [Marinobacter sp. SS21]
MLSVTLFVMLVLANGMPVIAHRLLGTRWSAPIDGGRCWFDGRPLFGSSKTWRGLVSGGLACALGASLMGLGSSFGLVFGLLALAGDLLSSFVKRRMGLAASAQFRGLDQVPEAALPMVYGALVLPLPWLEAVLVVVVFGLANVVLSPLLYRLGIRRHPH